MLAKITYFIVHVNTSAVFFLITGGCRGEKMFIRMLRSYKFERYKLKKGGGSKETNSLTRI